MNICKSKRCPDNELIALMPSYDEYKAKIGALNSEELGGKDHSSLGSWIDFMMKDEFVENTLNRLNLDPSKKPSVGKILNQDFANIGFDFLSVVKSNHADTAITSRRTPPKLFPKDYLNTFLPGWNVHLILALEITVTKFPVMKWPEQFVSKLTLVGRRAYLVKIL